MIEIYIHCSDSAFGNAATIALWHKERGFSTIGYHRVILNGKLSGKAVDKRFDGHVETGRPLDFNNHVESWEMGAHVLGHNSKSVGLCLIGKSGKFTQRQMKALEKEIIFLKKQFGEIKVFQHSDRDKKKPFCAGLTESQMSYLNQLVK